MWTLQQGETTHWTLFIQKREICTQSWTPPPPRVLGPHLCYANPRIQTTSQTCQTGSKADHGMAKQCYLSTAGLLPGHRLCPGSLENVLSWKLFKEAATYNNHTDLQEYSETVTAYIKSALMMWQLPRPSPHGQTRSLGWQQRFVGC